MGHYLKYFSHREGIYLALAIISFIAAASLISQAIGKGTKRWLTKVWKIALGVVLGISGFVFLVLFLNERLRM